MAQRKINVNETIEEHTNTPAIQSDVRARTSPYFCLLSLSLISIGLGCADSVEKDAPTTNSMRAAAEGGVEGGDTLPAEAGDDSSAPEGNAEPPEGNAEPPEGNAEPPEGNAEPPEGNAEPPEGNAEPPEGNAEPPEGNAEPPEGNTEPPEGNTEPPEGNTEPPIDPPSTVGYNLCGLGATAERASGTFEDPITAPYSPFVDENTTRPIPGKQDLYQSYDCAPMTREFGPEVVYKFTIETTALFTAEVQHDSEVDVDLHLLRDPTVDAQGGVSGCVGRAHYRLSIDDLEAGTYYLVVDSWTDMSGMEFEGDFRVAFEWIPLDDWAEAPITPTLTLKRSWATDRGLGRQLIHALVFDQPQDRIEPHLHNGCQDVNEVGQAQGAIAGINANFFVNCAPTDLLKEGGVLHSTNQTTMFEQRSIGWTAGELPTFEWIDVGVDWSEKTHAVGGYPSLVIDGQVRAEVYNGEQVYSSTDWTAQPRSAVGVDDQGQLVLAVVDGRSGQSGGLTQLDWAQWLDDAFDLREAIGLDGGGSSTLYVKGCWLNDLVNFPSGGAERHDGARAVASGLYLYR